jgi:hypothetical protein
MRIISPVVMLAFGLALWTAPPAAAQSFIDASKPMTGKSEFVFNADGTPAEMGAAAKAEPPAEVSQPGTARMRRTTANASVDGSGRASDSARRARSVFVVGSGGSEPKGQQAGAQRQGVIAAAPRRFRFRR